MGGEGRNPGGEKKVRTRLEELQFTVYQGCHRKERSNYKLMFRPGVSERKKREKSGTSVKGAV